MMVFVWSRQVMKDDFSKLKLWTIFFFQNAIKNWNGIIYPFSTDNKSCRNEIQKLNCTDICHIALFSKDLALGETCGLFQVLKAHKELLFFVFVLFIFPFFYLIYYFFILFFDRTFIPNEWMIVHKQLLVFKLSNNLNEIVNDFLIFHLLNLQIISHAFLG